MTVEEHICLDGILCRKGCFLRIKRGAKLLKLAFAMRFRSKLCNLGKERWTMKNTDEQWKP